MTLTLVMPMPANMGNARMHWRVKDKARRAYFKRLDHLQAAGSLPAPPAQPIVRAALRSAMVLGGEMDEDNAVARHKWPLDWLVTRGYLVSDKRECVRWAAFPEQRVTRKESPTITITLEAA